MIFQTFDGLTLVSGDLHEFRAIRAELASTLLETPLTDRAKWQRLDVSNSPAHATHELQNVTLHLNIGDDLDVLLGDTEVPVPADMPWARDHFTERVGGVPVNPGNTHEYWPYHGASAKLHQRAGTYQHNYMERFWPKQAGTWNGENLGWRKDYRGNPVGYRFPIGDLSDVVWQLQREPSTRQAYLPVWFPEDTGVTENQRVPCTLGYHFLVRDGRMSMNYYMRSCEIYRHFTNDVYLAVELLHWVARQVDVKLGTLTLHMASFHGFVGDEVKIRQFTLTEESDND